MSLPHFYVNDQVIAKECDAVFPLRLAADDARHARVLRLAPGEHIAVVDGAQDYFECEIVSSGDGLPLVRIAQRLDACEEGPHVLLVQGLAKGDKMELVIRHATELGVSGFVPFACERCVVKLDAKRAASKTERWRAIAKSAAMQSGQLRIPEVAKPASLDRVCALLAEATAVLICWEEAPGTASLAQALESGLAACGVSDARDARVAVVVGPEGGLSPREVEALLASNRRAALVSLGPSILRTETAGIVASALALYELGGLGRTMGGARAVEGGLR